MIRECLNKWHFRIIFAPESTIKKKKRKIQMMNLTLSESGATGS